MAMTKRLRIPTVLLLAAFFSACGGDDDSNGPNPTATRTRPVTETATPTSTPSSTPQATATPTEPPLFSYDVPLDPHSPWPKFRRNAVQNGRSPVEPVDTGAAPWTFQTGKGIFSTPVIGGCGSVYIGSADHVFYALDHTGELEWQFTTGEIIDSSALLDDKGRVYFGSGDGRLYALDRATGDLIWSYAADDPSVNQAFINWFEGNVAIGLGGRLFVPNDNFCTYGIDRDAGTTDWCYRTRDQTWSLPALNPSTNRLFMGNNWFFNDNTLSIDPTNGAELWTKTVQGSVAASPLVAATDGAGLVVVGSFDGFLRAYRQDSGDEVWKLGVRDHIYASPAQMEDGTIIQPAADGTVYAVRPEDGSVVWAFDTIEPIRSSPAIDANGNIYFGSGEGRLFVLNPDGTLRWSMLLIDDSRNDLNGSPALGNETIVIAGESGGVFGIPYDYCLRPEALQDDRCNRGPGEDLPSEGTFLFYTGRFGRLFTEAPSTIDANQPLTFSLLVRKEGDTETALIDSGSVEVTLDPPADAIVDVSGDRRFITVIPTGLYEGAGDATLRVRLKGSYLVNFDREGLRFTGGELGGSFDQTFQFQVRPRTADATFPLPVPNRPGDPSGVWELYRLAAPLPAILPSYNQIGFDSIHYLIGLVEGDENHAIGWGIGGRLAEDEVGEIDPSSRVRFPLEIRFDGGLLTMINEEGFVVEFNAFPIPFAFFRAATRVDESGTALESPALNAKTKCGEIDFYGPFLQLLGYCNPTTDLLEAFGAAELRPHRGGVQSLPEGVGDVSFTATSSELFAELAGSTLRADDHNVGILLVNPKTGRPVPLNYTASTTVFGNEEGNVDSVLLTLPDGEVSGQLRAYLMVDTYPAKVEVITVP